ncbi:MAG: rRNA pseudouridine synthase [Actinomycetota bacterium]|nr:rRNA pseudouridine synthase [Actinomycetota bacterium]
MNAAEGERLQKVLARAGLGSRRSVEELISQGRVKVNGEVATLGRRVDVSNDKVEVDGSAVPVRVDLVYYLLNKPPGVVTTAHDPQGRPTVLDFVESGRRIYPVGRLDVASEGALLLTNDGELAHRLTHPSFEVEKTYLVDVAGSVGARALKALATGVELDDGRTAPARVSVVEKSAGGTLVEVAIAEGRNRQVRRMFDAVDHRVRALVRTEIGPLKLGHLKPGSVRKLSPHEVGALYRLVQM